MAHIPSVERLEILLLLFDGRKHAWTIEELEEQIRSTAESVRQNVNALIASNLVARDAADAAKVRYTPGSEAQDAAVTELALVYRTRRVAVIELIYADRHGAARSISDAFNLRKPDDR